MAVFVRETVQMRIAIIGQAAFGRAVLEQISQNDLNKIVGIFGPPERPGGRLDPMVESALERDISVFQPVRFRSEEVYSQFAALKADLCVMAFVTDIVPMEIINAPRLGTIQYHPSLLPLHRGPSAINWAIIQGDAKTGLTIFWPDEGLDTGPVLMQKETKIGPDDTVGSVYFDRLFPMGVDALVESVELVRQGRAPTIVQDERMATYESHCDDSCTDIDWNRSTAEVHNLIRGCDPQPGAHTTFGSQILRLYGSRRLQGKEAQSGTVLSIDEHGMAVSTGDGAVRVARIRAPEVGKVHAVEAAASLGLRVGDRLGA